MEQPVDCALVKTGDRPAGAFTTNQKRLLPAYRRIRRWEHEAVLDTMQRRLDRQPEMMGMRRQAAEHPFGTIKYWMGSTHFLTKTLSRVSTEMSLHVLAYNLKRLMSILGIGPALAAMMV